MRVSTNLVLFLDCPEEEMVKRGWIDDNIDTIKKRLKVFEALNLPVIDYYAKKGKLHRVAVTELSGQIYLAMNMKEERGTKYASATLLPPSILSRGVGWQEEKKSEEKKPEEPKQTEEAKPAEKPDESKNDDKESKAEEAAPPPPPPPEIVLKVFMHCEGCARKVRRSLKGFPGVEDVITDCKSHKVVVKGDKADPLKVLERVQRTSHRQVELLSPIPKPPEEKKLQEQEAKPEPEEKKEEPQIVTVILKVHMHCEACAQEMKRRIQRMKGVESVEPDLKNSQ
ncbi:Heavy metal-associated domain, HMA, partial [Sesbania bispinosa]